MYAVFLGINHNLLQLSFLLPTGTSYFAQTNMQVRPTSTPSKCPCPMLSFADREGEKTEGKRKKVTGPKSDQSQLLDARVYLYILRTCACMREISLVSMSLYMWAVQKSMVELLRTFFCSPARRNGKISAVSAAAVES